MNSRVQPIKTGRVRCLGFGVIFLRCCAILAVTAGAITIKVS